MPAEPPLALLQLPDGVYLDLKEADYFAQDRLGSSDLMKLDEHREGWFWQSRHNLDRKNEQTDAQNYGSALHCITLEGMAEYERRFVVAPDRHDYARVIETVDEIKAALREANLDLKGTSGWAKTDWANAAEVWIPTVACWPNIMADFETSREIKAPNGEVVGKKPAVSAVEDRMLRIMLDAALRDEEIRGLLGYGLDVPSLAEVSFFWTDKRGVKRRARFDKPVPTFTMDLKSLGNWGGRELVHSIGDIIKSKRYGIQCGDQQEARRLMHQLLREKGEAAIVGGTPEQRTWLQAIAERNLPWQWVWLFYQKPEPSGRAPIIFPIWEHWRGPYHIDGFRRAMKARDFYLECVDEFGLGEIPAADGSPPRPWARVMPLHHTAPGIGASGAPIITLPHYGWDETPHEAEEEHFAR